MTSYLRITAPGWEAFTGNFGGSEFVNGVSTAALTRYQIDRVSALVRCDLSDAAGNMTVQAGSAERLVGGVSLGIETPNSLRLATQEELDADARQRTAEAGVLPTRIYTRDELEAIATKEGIAGIRKIGDAWSVRDRAINKIIELILKAQTAFTARQGQKADALAKARAEATADALAKHAAAEAAIDARARLVAKGGTSNAIGLNGENITINVEVPAGMTPGEHLVINVHVPPHEQPTATPQVATGAPATPPELPPTAVPAVDLTPAPATPDAPAQVS